MTAEPLHPEDVRILELEGPVVAGHTCKVIELTDDPPGLDELRAHVASRLQGVPRLRRRLDLSGPPAWVDDASFDVERHVLDAPPAERIETVAAGLMAGRLDRDRPLWTLHRVAGSSRPALVFRIHHALADGQAAMRYASQAIWDAAPEPRAAKPGGAAPARATPGRASTRAALRRELAPGSSRTPLDASLGRHRAVALAAAPLADLRRIEHAAGAGVTVNDVVLCAVAGGLRRWVPAAPAVPRHRAKVPVSLHHGDDEANRDSFICVDLDIQEPDPARRLLAISRESRTRKQASDADAIDRLFATLTERSPRAARVAARWTMSPRVFALNVSNVRGPAGPLAVLGRPVTTVTSLAEVAQRHALRIACVSAAGRMTFGLCADADALPDVDAVAEGIEAELDALLAAVGADQ